MYVGNFPEMLTQAMLVGIVLVGRLGVAGATRTTIISTCGWGRAVLSVLGLSRPELPYWRRGQLNVCEQTPSSQSWSQGGGFDCSGGLRTTIIWCISPEEMAVMIWCVGVRVCVWAFTCTCTWRGSLLQRGLAAWAGQAVGWISWYICQCIVYYV